MGHRQLKMLCSANKMLQLLCEGHNISMQNYLRHQMDNKQSINILEQTHRLLSRLCKDSIALDAMDNGDLQLIVSALELLVEMLQGPCEANQEHLATTGIIEIFM